jgi:hypothetical protein
MAKQSEEKLLSVSQVLRIFDLPRHKLTYLFESRRLKAEEFITLDNGQKLFRQSDLAKIKEAIFNTENK